VIVWVCDVITEGKGLSPELLVYRGKGLIVILK